MNERGGDFERYIIETLVSCLKFPVSGHGLGNTPENIEVFVHPENGPEIVAKCSSCGGNLVANLVTRSFEHRAEI